MFTRSRLSPGARTWLVAVVMLGVAGVALPKAGAPPQKAADKSVFVTVMDADNNPVADMTKDEFGVREDGADRAIVDLKPASQPLDIFLMVDTTRGVSININELRDGLKAFSHTIYAGNPQATFSVMNVASAAVLTADHKKTPEDVDKILSKTFPDQGEPTVFLEGMADVGKRMMKSTTPRRVIMLINLEGVPEVSTLQPPSVIKQVVDSGAAMWVVSYANDVTKRMVNAASKGGIGSANTGQNRDVLLKMLPPGTGGMRLMLEVPAAIEDSLVKVAKALLAQYEMIYTRPDGATPKLLQLGVTRTGVKMAYPQTPPK